MYRDIPKFYNYEVLEYDRKSRSDDPLLSVEEVLERHGKILEEYALKSGLHLTDALIFATACEHSLTLCSGNEKYCQKIRRFYSQ